MRLSALLDITPQRDASSWWFVLCLVLLAAIAWADYWTGYELSLAILYLVPVYIAAWVLGRDAGLMVSLLAASVSLISMALADQPYSHPFFHFWNAAVRFITFALFAFIIARLKRALGQADERFVTMLEGLDAAVFVTGVNGELLYANSLFHHITAAGGRLQAAPDPAQLSNGKAPERAPPPDLHEDEFHDPGTGRWYLIHSRTILWVDGRPVRLRLATDITDRRAAEELSRQQQEKLQQTARLIAVGEMASTLAHEINQPLAAIANYNRGSVRRLRSGNWKAEELLDAMEKASVQAERAGKVIHRVRELVRRREPEFSEADINGIVLNVRELFEIEAEKSRVQLVVEPAPALPKVRADVVMLEQVMLNLLKNAIEAMRDTPEGPRRIEIRTAVRGDSVEVAISDRGCGVSAEGVAKLFSAFFTTKPQGMGLGLHICRSILEMHSGRLWHEANPAGGSIFFFSLPAAP